MAVVVDREIEIRRVSVAWVRENLSDVLAEHWQEIGDPDLPVDPAWALYEMLEKAGCLIVFALFVGDTPAGYSVVTITPHTMSQAVNVAHVKLIYVRQDMRGFHAGEHLMEQTRAAARLSGACMCFWSARPDTPMERILSRQLGNPLEIVFQETLEEESL